MSAYQIIYLLVAHFISHYLLQFDSISIQRAKHFSWLMLHSVLYLLSLFFIMLLGILWFDGWALSAILDFCVMVGMAHFVIGYIMSRINDDNKGKKKYYLVLIGVGFEQLLYTVIIVFMFNFFMI